MVGEILAGLCLGPSLLGRFAPELQAFLLPASVAPFLGILAQIGVILFMFIVGLELDTGLLRKRSHATLAISHASIVAPFLLGATFALWLYPRMSSSDVPFTVFALFAGVSVSVTAFPHVVLRPAHVLWVADNPHECFVTAPRDVVESHTPIALRFLAVLDAMVRLYHRSDCDSQRDHFDVNFWFHGADFATALEQRQRARILEANGRDVPSYLSRFVGNVTP